jgi:hypothetical protein
MGGLIVQKYLERYGTFCCVISVSASGRSIEICYSYDNESSLVMHPFVLFPVIEDKKGPCSWALLKTGLFTCLLA